MFVRLIAAADDAGNYYGDPALVLAYLFGHRMAKGEVSVTDIDEWMDELVTNSLISVYGTEIKCIHINNARRRHRTDVKPDYRFPAYSGNDVDEHRSESVTDAARARDENVPSDADADADADAEENLLVVEADPRTQVDKDRDELMDYLNFVTGRTGASKFTSHGGLKERLKAGVPVDDLKLVIDFKQAQWNGDEKMRAYVRPKTLFGPENFPGYLSEARAWDERGRPIFNRNGPRPQAATGSNEDYDSVVQKG